MSTASVANAFVASTTIESAKVNENFQDLVAFLNTSVVQSDGSTPMSGALTLPGVPTSALHAATKSYVDLLAPPSAYSTYIPALAQSGAVAKTVNYAKYQTRGKNTHGNVKVSITGSGVGGAPVAMNLPVNTAAGLVALVPIGSWWHFDASAGLRYAGTLVTFTGGPDMQTWMFAHGSTSAYDTALANGDILGFFFDYESA